MVLGNRNPDPSLPCMVRHSGEPLHLHSLRLFGNSIVQAVNDHPHGSALNLLCPRVSSEITVEVILCKYSRQIHSQTKLASEESAQANCGFRQARPDRQVRKLIKLTLPPLGERKSFWEIRFLSGRGEKSHHRIIAQHGCEADFFQSVDTVKSFQNCSVELCPCWRSSVLGTAAGLLESLLWGLMIKTVARA